MKKISQSFMNKKVCISTNNAINYQNGFCLREIQVHYFHDHYAYQPILVEIHSDLNINEVYLWAGK